MATKNTITVGVDASRGIVVKARGRPAGIVAYGAAAGIVTVPCVVHVAALREVLGESTGETKPVGPAALTKPRRKPRSTG